MIRHLEQTLFITYLDTRNSITSQVTDNTCTQSTAMIRKTIPFKPKLT